MSQELVYTSVPRGLLPGSTGFCTVAMTRGLAPAWREALERASTYARLPKGDPRQHPVSHSHLRLAVGAEVRSILSRVASAGLDHTQRTNHLAHHIALTPDECARLSAGPAQLLLHPKLLRESFLAAPSELDPRPLPAVSDFAPGGGSPWERITGDAGWGRVLAQAFEAGQSCVLVFEPKQDLLPLIAESLNYLSPERRWAVSFSTYAPAAVAGVQCRGVVRGTPAEKEARALERTGTLVLDVCLGAGLGRAPATPFAPATAAAVPLASGMDRPASEWDIDFAAMEHNVGNFTAFPTSPQQAFAAAAPIFAAPVASPPVRFGDRPRGGPGWLTVTLAGAVGLLLGGAGVGVGGSTWLTGQHRVAMSQKESELLDERYAMAELRKQKDHAEATAAEGAEVADALLWDYAAEAVAADGLRGDVKAARKDAERERQAAAQAGRGEAKARRDAAIALKRTDAAEALLREFPPPAQVEVSKRAQEEPLPLPAAERYALEFSAPGRPAALAVRHERTDAGANLRVLLPAAAGGSDQRLFTFTLKQEAGAVKLVVEPDDTGPAVRAAVADLKAAAKLRVVRVKDGTVAAEVKFSKVP